MCEFIVLDNVKFKTVVQNILYFSYQKVHTHVTADTHGSLINIIVLVSWQDRTQLTMLLATNYSYPYHVGRSNLLHVPTNMEILVIQSIVKKCLV